MAPGLFLGPIPHLGGEPHFEALMQGILRSDREPIEVESLETNRVAMEVVLDDLKLSVDDLFVKVGPPIPAEHHSPYVVADPPFRCIRRLSVPSDARAPSSDARALHESGPAPPRAPRTKTDRVNVSGSKIQDLRLASAAHELGARCFRLGRGRFRLCSRSKARPNSTQFAPTECSHVDFEGFLVPIP